MQQKAKYIKISPDHLTYTIGRSEDSDIYLNSPQVSRFHAEINILSANSMEIEDLDSKYGTLVNGRRIKRHVLRDKDRVLIGIFEFVVQINHDGMALHFPVKKPENNFVAEYDLSRHSSLLIGRGKNCTVFLDSQQVSRNHARIEREGDNYVLLDLESTNGSFVNGKKTDKKSLKNRDIIQIGPIRFLFVDGKVFQLNEKDLVRIDALNISKTVKGNTIMRDVSISMLPREFVGLLGPSGAGKSTLMHALNGNILPDTGEVRLNGMSFTSHYDSFKHLVGFVPQQDIIHHELTVYNTLFYAAELRLPEDMTLEEKKKRVDKIINILELDERKDATVSSLSGGQRKRVNLGVELITDPAILFLDEPTSGLDPGLDQKMMQLFRRIADSGQTVILATHNLNEVALFDLVAVIYEGDLVYYGPPSDLTTYFKVEKINDVYNRLAYPPEGGWVQRFRGSIYFKDYVISRLNTKSKEESYDSMIVFNPAFSFFRQFKTLVKRYLGIISHDLTNVAILLGQAPIVAILLILVFMNYRNVWSLLFCFSLSAVWFGCINSVREITKEKHIFARERVVCLKTGPYIFSKIAVLFTLCLIQCIVLIVTVSSFVKIEGNLLLMFVVILLSSICGLTLGLFISSVAGTSDKAVGVLPIILIPQILFSGTVVELDNMMPASQEISRIMVLRWSYGLLKKISMWKSDPAWDNGYIALIAFIPIFIAATFYFQKRKDIRR